MSLGGLLFSVCSVLFGLGLGVWLFGFWVCGGLLVGVVLFQAVIEAMGWMDESRMVSGDEGGLGGECGGGWVLTAFPPSESSNSTRDLSTSHRLCPLARLL